MGLATKLTPADEENRLINLDTVIEIVQQTRSCIYRDITLGLFPKPVKINSSSRWLAVEIHRWVQKKVTLRDNGDIV